MNYFAQRYPSLISKIALHITCTEKTKIELLQSVTHFYKFGIRQFVVIRGDGTIHANGFKYASELVEVIRTNFLDVAIYVAGYPENDAELEFTNKKIELGVNACITQVCFDSKTIAKFRDNLKLPVLPGLVLPTEKSLDFSKKLGLALPTADINDQSLFLRKQIEELIDNGFHHFHFYTLNNIDNLLYLFYDSI